MTVLSTDPLCLELDPVTNDLVVHPDGLRFIGGEAAVAELVTMAIQMFRSEWFADRAVGVPWYQQILGHQPTDDQIIRAIAAEILKAPAVSEVVALTIERDNEGRVATVPWEVKATWGDTISGEFVNA